MESSLTTAVGKASQWLDSTGVVSDMQQKQTGGKGQEKIFSSYCFVFFLVLVFGFLWVGFF